jgi:deoxyribonuclease V
MFAELQRFMSQLTITQDFISVHQIRRVCGVDVSYHENIAFCSVVNMDRSSFQIVEAKECRYLVDFPYISGLFFLREADAILKSLRKLESSYDVLIVNGHGILHPRRMGLASFVGLLVDSPTIGVAKRLLCGEETGDDRFVSIDHDICGKKIVGQGNKCIYVSVGHKMSLESSVRLIKELTIGKNFFPEPLTIADRMSRKFRISFLNEHRR